ncbi:hypothetical protein LEP1GSC052_3561 [Leptospira kmetyi serovar Malaysia str. Bejo-Iso9]|nr:hypothetical protein LEP1GSC052_3561 [Leptospira kmetyi serovar Malaysia str. Bejo-Iso9]
MNENTVFLEELLYSNENSGIRILRQKKKMFMFGIINYVAIAEIGPFLHFD